MKFAYVNNHVSNRKVNCSFLGKVKPQVQKQLRIFACKNAYFTMKTSVTGFTSPYESGKLPAYTENLVILNSLFVTDWVHLYILPRDQRWFLNDIQFVCQMQRFLLKILVINTVTKPSPASLHH